MIEIVLRNNSFFPGKKRKKEENKSIYVSIQLERY